MEITSKRNRRDIMADKNLKYFMRTEALEEKVLTVPGLESIKDENGKVVDLKIKKLHNETISKINEMYRSRTPLKDKKKGFIVQDGEAVYKVERDRAKAARHMMVEALIYPNLKDPELMKFFNCVDVTDMPLKVFPDNDEYGYVSKKVMEVIGLVDPEEKDQKEVDEAKN